MIGANYSDANTAVFIGDTAAISFLRFLQHTLKRHAGPSNFTDDQDTQRLFEAADPDAVSPAFQDDLTFEVKEELTRCFLDVVRLLPVFFYVFSKIVLNLSVCKLLTVTAV